MNDGTKRSIIKLDSVVESAASIVGKMEHEGPLGNFFDSFDPTDEFGQDTWEKSESEMQRLVLNKALDKGGFKDDDIDIMFGGDLLNQCIAGAYGLEKFDISYMGLFGACSTIAEAMILASAMTSYGIYNRCAAVTSSHNCSAEMQFRTPLEYGGQRPPSAQWTVTGAGALIVRKPREYENGVAYITEALAGRVIDAGIKDASNMGAAMAPAAANTLLRYFNHSGKKPNDFDLIVTGDLGYEGSAMLCDLMRSYDTDISSNHNDCGMMIYSHGIQDVHAGGSGCGCSAVVLASYLLPKIKNGEINDMLFVGTGALMNASSLKQGLSIPGIGHLVRISSARMNTMS